MIAAFDVHYFGDNYASAAAVLFDRYSDAKAAGEHVILTHGISPYISGQFYRRELPCILRLLEQFSEIPDEIIIDGYVMLGDRPGLGHHLFECVARGIPVIGVAKSKHKNSSGIEVLRGSSKKPLYVTAAGINPRLAAVKIMAMHGAYRVPTLLKRVDLLARQEAEGPQCE